MSRANPMVVLVGGPNGAGKSTVAPRLIGGALALRDFVNADVIAQGLSAYSPEGAALEAGRIMWERIRDLAAARRTFSLETTLAARSLAGWVRDQLKPAGYQVKLVFLWLPSVELAIERVSARVRAGGHDVPEVTVRRRHWLGLKNLFCLYLPLLDRWRVYNNAPAHGPLLVASGSPDRQIRIARPIDWRHIREQADHA